MSSKEEKLSLEQVDKVESVVRELIRHENDLVHQRLTWLIQSQGLLFTALAFAWDKEPLALMLSILGIATAISMWTAIANYSPAVRRLLNWWDTNVSDEHKKGRFVIGLWSPSQGLLSRLLRPWRALPLIFIFAWVGVLIVQAFVIALPNHALLVPR